MIESNLYKHDSLLKIINTSNFIMDYHWFFRFNIFPKDILSRKPNTPINFPKNPFHKGIRDDLSMVDLSCGYWSPITCQWKIDNNSNFMSTSRSHKTIE